jgi:hypothetical protein
MQNKETKNRPTTLKMSPDSNNEQSYVFYGFLDAMDQEI